MLGIWICAEGLHLSAFHIDYKLTILFKVVEGDVHSLACELEFISAATTTNIFHSN